MSWKKGNRLPMVTEAQSTGRTREIYDELKEALGLPHVNVVFQVYGGYPAFLDAFWKVFKPVVESAKFFELGERLRADAYTRMHNYFEIPDFCEQVKDLKFSEGARNELTEVVDLFLYNNPLTLLLTLALTQAMEGPIGIPGPQQKAEHPVFTRRPVLVDEESAPISIRKIYEDIKRVSEMPVVNSDLRAVARWPDFLRVFWETMRPTMESPIYHQAQNGIRETAWALAKEIPGPMELSITSLDEAGVEEDEINSIVRMTDLFSHGLCGMTLNVAVAKIGLEGGNRQRAHEAEAEKEAASGESGLKEKQPTRAA